MSGFLLDTNVLSEYTKPKPEPKVHAWLSSVGTESLYVSVLTFGEIQRGIASLPSSLKRTRLQLWLDQDLKPRFGHRVISIDEDVAEQWGKMMGVADTSGRPLPIIDSLLVATALWHNFTFVTRDVGPFATTGVQVFNPWED